MVFLKILLSMEVFPQHKYRLCPLGLIILSKNMQQNLYLMVSSSITDIFLVKLFLSSCMGCSGKSVSGSLISVKTEFLDVFTTFLPSSFETRKIVILQTLFSLTVFTRVLKKKVTVLTTFVSSTILHSLYGWNFFLLNAVYDILNSFPTTVTLE